MVLSYANQVTKSINYILKRAGSSIVYKRMQSSGQWSPTGITEIFWEQPTFNAVVYDVQTSDVEESGGRLALGDKAFAFLKSEFTDHSSSQYVKFTSGSVEFTVGEILTGVSDGATGVVVDWYEDSGTWVGGDATGVVWLSTITGAFNASEALNGSVGGLNIATTTATNTSGGTDDLEPKAGDKIVYGGDTYELELADEYGGTIIKEDVTKITFTVYGRVKNG